MLVLDPRIAKPFPPNKLRFYCNSSPVKDLKQHCATKQDPTTTLTWTIINRVDHCLHYMQKTHKTAQHCENTSNFKTASLPYNLTRLPEMHTR